MTVTFKEVQYRSYTEFYIALVDAIGEDEAKRLIGPLIDVSVEIYTKKKMAEEHAAV